MTSAATSPGRHLVDGTMRLFLAEALVFPTGLITAAFLTRTLQPTGYGVFTLAAVMIAWLEWIPPALFSRAAVKFVSESQDGGVATAVLRLYAGTGLAIAAVGWILAPWIANLMSEPSLTSNLRLFTIQIPIFAAAYAHRNILVGRGQYRRQSMVSAIRWSTRLALMVALVAGGLSVRGAVLGSIGASVVELAVLRYFVRPALFGHTAVPIRQICAFAAPLFLSAICARLFDRVDLLTLTALGEPAAQAGFYGAAQNVALAPNLLALSFTPLLLGTLSRLLREGERGKAFEIGGNALRSVICLAPFAAVAFAVSGDLSRAVFGSAFAPAAPLIGPLVSAALALVMSSAGSTMVIAADRPRWVLYSTAPLPFVAIAGHLIFIPRFGPVGAASVTMGAAILSAAVSLIQVYRLWRIHPPWATCLRSAAIAAAAWGVATYWPAVLLVKLPVIAAFIIAAFAVTGEFEIPAVYRLRIASAARASIPMAVFLLAAIVLQWRDGAFHAEFDGHPDEAGHFITSLMIRDYAATRIGTNPLAFARDYYLHYPRVALGHWPP
ncbi:MAG TPA: oligosaccharide flippase family protein, partial [Candidatus Solibacter sp.]|nr:oligosaccharide flippase family protein [Candidatus Solibacter sp.]